MPIFIEETNPGITDNQNSFSGISFPGSNANYVGQTMGPGGMGMSAYMDRPETQSGWTGYDYRPGYNTNTYNLGQTDGPVGMGMSAYMDRPGPMEMAAPPDNIGYDRMGPGPWNEFNIPNPMQQGLDLPNRAPYRVEQVGLFDDPTADGGWIDNLSRWWYGDDDPENDYLTPDDEMFGTPIEEDELPLMEANLESNDLYHLMRNGYTLEEAQQILNEQIGDGSFEMAEAMQALPDEREVAEALTPDASFKILQGLADKSPEYFYKTLPMIYGDDLWDETPMFNYGGDFYGNSELSWG